MSNDAAHDALEAFIRELKRFYAVECGRPSMRELARKSEWMIKRYPDRKLQVLSPTAIADVLNHRRKSFPTSAWLASLILACQRCAWELGVIPEDPGFITLPEWHRRLREAREACEVQSGPQLRETTAQKIVTSWTAKLLAAVAARLLSRTEQTRYLEEFAAELWDHAHTGAGKWRQIRHAYRLLVNSWRLRMELKAPHRRKASP